MTKRGANLSQGQRQMVTFARAMVAQPKIMVLNGGEIVEYASMMN